MGYIKYGKIFKKLRVQSGYSLKELSYIGISKSSLSRFERGQSMISLEYLWMLLDLMGISLQEFEYYLNGYEDSESDWLIDQVLIAMFHQDRAKLSDLRVLAQSQNHPHIELAAKASLTVLSPLEQNYLLIHFKKIQLWNRKELCIFFLVMNELSSPEVFCILKSFIECYDELFNSERYKFYLAQVFCRGVTLFSFRGEKEFATELMDDIFSHRLNNSMHSNNLVNLCRGYWFYCFGDMTYGNELMERALVIFKLLESHQVAKYYEDRYNRFVFAEREKRRKHE